MLKSSARTYEALVMRVERRAERFKSNGLVKVSIHIRRGK